MAQIKRPKGLTVPNVGLAGLLYASGLFVKRDGKVVFNGHHGARHLPADLYSMEPNDAYKLVLRKIGSDGAPHPASHKVRRTANTGRLVAATALRAFLHKYHSHTARRGAAAPAFFVEYNELAKAIARSPEVGKPPPKLCKMLLASGLFELQKRGKKGDLVRLAPRSTMAAKAAKWSEDLPDDLLSLQPDDAFDLIMGRHLQGGAGRGGNGHCGGDQYGVDDVDVGVDVDAEGDPVEDDAYQYHYGSGDADLDLGVDADMDAGYHDGGGGNGDGYGYDEEEEEERGQEQEKAEKGGAGLAVLRPPALGSFWWASSRPLNPEPEPEEYEDAGEQWEQEAGLDEGLAGAEEVAAEEAVEDEPWPAAAEDAAAEAPVQAPPMEAVVEAAAAAVEARPVAVAGLEEEAVVDAVAAVAAPVALTAAAADPLAEVVAEALEAVVQAVKAQAEAGAGALYEGDLAAQGPVNDLMPPPPLPQGQQQQPLPDGAATDVGAALAAPPEVPASGGGVCGGSDSAPPQSPCQRNAAPRLKGGAAAEGPASPLRAPPPPAAALAAAPPPACVRTPIPAPGPWQRPPGKGSQQHQGQQGQQQRPPAAVRALLSCNGAARGANGPRGAAARAAPEPVARAAPEPPPETVDFVEP